MLLFKASAEFRLLPAVCLTIIAPLQHHRTWRASAAPSPGPAMDLQTKTGLPVLIRPDHSDMLVVIGGWGVCVCVYVGVGVDS